MKKNSSANLPAFQFYPNDWLSDMNLRMCSVSTRGIWIDLLCLMHKSKKYGFLVQKVDGKWSNMSPKIIQKLTGLTTKRIINGLRELAKNDVIKYDENGLIYSKRMVKDQALRDVRKKAGSLGGNPVLLNQTDKQTSNQKTTPSSLSSSSSSSSVKEEAGNSKIIFNRKTWTFENITEDHIVRWKQAFPLIDVWTEILRAGMWLESKNQVPNNRASEFLFNWFKKAKPEIQESDEKPDSYYCS